MESRELSVLPLRNLVLFPGLVMPVDIGRASSLRLVNDAVARGEHARLGIFAQRSPRVDDPTAEDLNTIGVEAEILKVVRLAENRLTIVVRGVQRIRLAEVVKHEPWLVARVEPVADILGDDTEIAALASSVREAGKQLLALSPDAPKEAAAAIDAIDSPSALADMNAANLDLGVEDRLALLGEPDVQVRLRKILTAIDHRIQVLEVKARIDTQVREEMSKDQRNHVLRQKMKAIQEELGENDDQAADLEELKTKIDEAGMPEDVEKVARKQLSRLQTINSASPEHSVTRTYLEWLLDMPWKKETVDNLDLDAAGKVLEADHYALDQVKKRIVEYLAVSKLAPHKKGPFLCLVGPPGVGKTSLGKSIARALGRELVRVSLGGVRDESEIRGHRRTYIGALPGRIVQGMKRAGTKNPVFILDELDKVGADFRGDPSAALLEVLDPEQNNSFSDHYLEVPYDLSRVIWIATANDLDPIPAALRDRLEVIELPGYTHEEKRHIARQYLVPRQLSEHGITEHHLTLDDHLLDVIIERYTREAGVRNLERELGTICRGIAVKVAAGIEYKIALSVDDIAELLGPEKFMSDIAERTEIPGVATGLAWTPSGGDIMFIEMTRMMGTGKLVLTGQLGDVMKESAQAALSYVRSHAQALGIAPNFFEKSDLHIHLPAGGIPKEGPSAGVTLITAMVSLLTGRRVRHDVAMTGEITLRGQVLPIGGVKEKVLAAHRAGITTVLLPERNRKDLVDIPAQIQKEMEIKFMRRVDDVLAAALEPLADVVVAPSARDLLDPELPEDLLLDTGPVSTSLSGAHSPV